MKPLGIFLIVLGVLCFFGPFFTAEPKKERHVQPGFESVTQTELGSVFPLMGISSIATGGALLVAAAVTGGRGRLR